MSPLIVTCLFLTLALSVAALVVLQLRRRISGLQAILDLLTQTEFHHADPPSPESSAVDAGDLDADHRDHLDRLRSVGSRPE